MLDYAQEIVNPLIPAWYDVAFSIVPLMLVAVTIGIQVLPLESSEAASIARIRNQYRLRMPHAVVIQAAISTGSEVATFDESLALAAGKAGLGVAR